MAADSHLGEAPASIGGPPSILEALPNSNLDETLLDDELDAVAPAPHAPEITCLLALDECLAQRQY